MQHLLIIFLYMIRLSVVVSFAGLGNSIRSTALSGFGSIDSILLQRSRPFTVRHLSSTSSSSSDSGKENASNKTARKKPVVPPKSYPPSAEIDKRGISVEKKGQSRQNSAGRRVSEADRPQRPNPLRENKNYVSNPPTNAFEEFTQEFRQVIQSREFVPAMALYARMKEIKMHPRESILTGLLSICQRKEHLVNAIEIFADFIAAGIAPNESAYISLIRCYSDNGNVEEALELIEQMNIRKLEPKLRTYHPILEAVCKENDFESAILIIKQMQVSNVVPRSEQVTLLLEVAASSRGLYTTQGQEQIEQILQSASIDLLGMETEEMRRVVAAFCRKTSEEVLEEGILVETRDDLPGEILEISDNSKASKLRAMNNTYVNVPTVISDVTVSPSVIDVTVPYGFDWMNSQGKTKQNRTEQAVTMVLWRFILCDSVEGLI